MIRKAELADLDAVAALYEAVHNAEEAGLTDRETEVFLLLAQGYGSQSISDKLVVSIYTTRAHTRSIYNKLGVHSRKDLMDLVDLRVGQRLASR